MEYPALALDLEKLLMSRRLVSIIAALVTIVTASSSALAASSTPVFSSATVSKAQFVGEPRVFVDPTSVGTKYYVVAPGADGKGHINTLMWWSSDGRSWKGPATTNRAAGGNDSDIAIDSSHTVYVADLSDENGDATIPISVFDPRTGRFSKRGKVARPGSELDRQWIASPARRTLVATAQDFDTGNAVAWMSTDGGSRFSGAILVDSDVEIMGPLVTGAAASGKPAPLYFLYMKFIPDETTQGLSGRDDLRLARSTDGGRHWTTSLVAPDQNSILFPVVASDSTNGLYAAWSGYDAASENYGVIVFASSTNGGRTWTKPTAVSDTRKDPAGDTPPAVFPWVVAGVRGRVDVTYVIANRPALNSPYGPDDGGPETTWDLRLAQSGNATSSKPTWTNKIIAPSFHAGSICTSGAGCIGPQSFLGTPNLPTPFDRRHLDFFGSALDPRGNLFVAYTADRPALTGEPNDLLEASVDVKVARQVGGATLGRR